MRHWVGGLEKAHQAGKKTQYGYDPLGRLTTVTQLLNNLPLVTSYAYDEIGNRDRPDGMPNGHTTKYSYDQMGRRSSRTLPLGQSESYSYDVAGNLASRTDFNQHTTTFGYDNMNRLKQKTADVFVSTGACAPGAGPAGLSAPCGASQISYTYSATGRRLQMTDATGAVHSRINLRLGTLLVLTEEPMSGESPDHVANTKRAVRSLRRAGLIPAQWADCSV